MPQQAARLRLIHRCEYLAFDGALRLNLGQSLQTVKQTVKNLLISIKALLKALDEWGHLKRTDEQLSDEYVQFGNDFNDAIEAFGKLGVDMSCVMISVVLLLLNNVFRDLNPVPEALRRALEDCLSEEASPEILQQYLPPVQQIMTQLLQGLRDRGYVVTENQI